MPVSSWDVVLRDGSTLHIRPALPTDGAAIRAFFETLSDESRRQRFLAACSPSAVAMPELIHNDPSAQFSLIAEDGRGIVALASYFRDPAAPSQAECAVAVADVFQGRGLGTRLIELLAEVAHAIDISVFTAYALYDNRRMLDVFRECGYPADLEVKDGWYEIRLEIDGSGTQERKHFERARLATVASLRPIFAPQRVAVVGVGRDGGVGAAIFKNLRGRFTGRRDLPSTLAPRPVRGSRRTRGWKMCQAPWTSQ